MAASRVPPPARAPLTPPALALRQLCEHASRQLYGHDWWVGITEVAWRLATEPADVVVLDEAADDQHVAEVRQVFSWWADRGGVWLDETEGGLVELPLPHWIASRTPVVEPVSALEDPNVQLAVATADTRCARCGTEIATGDTYGLVQVPDGPSGWCCQSCVTGAG